MGSVAILNRLVLIDLIYKVTLEQRLERDEEVGHKDNLVKGIPGRGNST